MHNELRYQAKIQAIFDMARKEKIKFPTFSPPIFFIFLFIKKNNNKDMLYGNNIIGLACKERSNL
jgi:hypothetical protein